MVISKLTISLWQAAVCPSPQQTSSIVEYSIVLSPTYRVPVLHFTLRNLPSPLSPTSIDTVYRLLVPPDFRGSLESVGVMGSISMGVSGSYQVAFRTSKRLTRVTQNHPFTDFPSFFVHPCNTADAMRELLRGRRVSPVEYLMIWLGLVGSCVGLHIPRDVALAMNSTDQQ